MQIRSIGYHHVLQGKDVSAALDVYGRRSCYATVWTIHKYTIVNWGRFGCIYLVIQWYYGGVFFNTGGYYQAKHKTGHQNFVHN